jgi:hypothetical protein
MGIRRTDTALHHSGMPSTQAPTLIPSILKGEKALSLPLPYTTPYTFFHRWLVPFFEMRTKNEMKFDNQTKKGVVETFDTLSSLLSSKT